MPSSHNLGFRVKWLIVIISTQCAVFRIWKYVFAEGYRFLHLAGYLEKHNPISECVPFWWLFARVLPLCPWCHCWRAGRWTGRQPPGWSRDWGFSSPSAPEAHIGPPTSRTPLYPSEVLARKWIVTEGKKRGRKTEDCELVIVNINTALFFFAGLGVMCMKHKTNIHMMVDSQLQFTNPTSKWDYPR